MTELQAPQPREFRLCETEDGRTRVECPFVVETLWLPQANMADLFQASEETIATHLRTIPAEGELDSSSVVNHRLTTAADGKNCNVPRKQADAHTESWYKQLAARRRALREAEGAGFDVRALEGAARALPKPDSRKK